MNLSNTIYKGKNLFNGLAQRYFFVPSATLPSKSLTMPAWRTAVAAVARGLRSRAGESDIGAHYPINPNGLKATRCSFSMSATAEVGSLKRSREPGLRELRDFRLP